ncbi:MAG TPA: aminotransferase class V-fold PLP-dependent enzyme, partial [Thermomicrobiaceae bacterium]|nr:aminotransferase class V-fold PLP-dependent enzyme [Thermomicrobiaceae bacterium]
DLGVERGGIVSLTLDDIDPDEIKQRLAAERINVTTSTTFSTRFDMEARGLTKVVRASLHYYNTEEEIDCFVDALTAMHSR